ncbi:acyl--CoA ligase family protein [Saccharopolyspora montiporae]|uniref:acyl--CoA ligase family protein n=1 Tax=Saccharopolyspora montiporae TaxID=2781240 RepID=UPI00351CAF8B
MSGIAFRELSPVSFLQRAAEVFADRPAVVDGADVRSYAEFWDRAQRMAGALVARGIQPGDRVAVLAPNSPVLLEAHYGVPLAGAVLVALNTRLSAAEIGYILQHSGSRLLLVDDALTELAERALGELGADAPEAVGADRFERELRGAEPHRHEITDERGLLSLNYTSGTTGRPKGVMYHHRGAYLQALAMAYHAQLDTSARYLWTLPMFHTNGWCFPWAVTAAGAVHQCLRAVDPAEIWRAVHEDGVTHFCAAPTVLTGLTEHPAAARPQQVVRVFAGGAPPWPALLERTGELGLDVRHLYGLTETFGPAVVCEVQPEWASRAPDERARLIARQGIANVIAEPVRVADPEGRDVPADGETAGELLLRGNDVMLGYYRDEEATAAATLDGWFRSGDLAVRHPDGYVEIRDRLKDVIISGGENIASVEVENALTAHPDVLEAAVVGVPDEKWGEVPVAHVALRSGARTTEQELIDHVRERIARFKAPRYVVFGDLPKTSTGKLRKNVLRQRSRTGG